MIESASGTSCRKRSITTARSRSIGPCATCAIRSMNSGIAGPFSIIFTAASYDAQSE